MEQPNASTASALRSSRVSLLRSAVPWRAYAQLVRLPAVFTALADICLGGLGAWAAGTSGFPWLSFLFLLGASACLYSAGMVWNDFFDIEQDRRERPFRPLPSGRISRRAAALFGIALLALGWVLAASAGWRSEGMRRAPLLVSSFLVLTILLYDGWLKRTWAGPVAMGSCRFLNVLLGLSIAEAIAFPWSARIYLALVVGLYIVGVTWFARTEARTSSQAALTGAAGVMLAALILAVAVPVWLPSATTSVLFPYLLVVLGFLLGIPASHAIAKPTPSNVQSAVKRALLGLIVLNAVLATALVGTVGLCILLLLLPSLYLGRWLYAT
jgi:4-hydroxybenzoate polyprenyltransferase